MCIYFINYCLFVCAKANPPQFDKAEELSQLRFLNESSVLHTLRQRYASNLIHTYAGDSMIVINPVAPLAIYSEKARPLLKVFLCKFYIAIFFLNVSIFIANYRIKNFNIYYCTEFLRRTSSIINLLVVNIQYRFFTKSSLKMCLKLKFRFCLSSGCAHVSRLQKRGYAAAYICHSAVGL